MEVRKITIVSTKTQKKSVIMTGAETLGQLKEALDNAGIDYEDMTFYEGTSKTELKTDESVLPKDVPYTNRSTGETKNTNELVFMLTNTNKKIKSGSMTRAQAYDTIKSLNLQEVCKNTYGKNFTQCSTLDLINLIDSTKVSSCNSNTIKSSEKVVFVDYGARKAIETLVNYLYCQDCINYAIKQDILSILSKDVCCYKSESESPYSDNEIDLMFEGMC